MKEAYRRLHSTLPERHAPAAGALTSHPRALRAWVEALPTANVEATATRMRDGLGELNRQRGDGLQRLEALESLRAPLTRLASALGRQVLGASFPLPPQKEELGVLAMDLQGEFACGYRSALAEITAPGGAVPLLRGKTVALAAARALQHGGECLAAAYHLYRTPPHGAWRSLHDTYRFVAAVRLDDRAVTDPLERLAECARDRYSQALLLALANPYSHTQREQLDVQALARVLAPHLQLRARNGGPRDVVVHADTDRGPGYTPAERDEGQGDVLALNLAALATFVDGQLASTPPGARTATLRQRGGSAQHVDVDLLRRVAASWSAHGARAHVRLGGGYTLDTVLGLHDLHYVLAGEEDFESFMQGVGGQAISLSAHQRGASWRLAAQNPGRAARWPARVLDQGSGGYRLLWERSANGMGVRARVADLVGFALPTRADEDTPDWMVGVIRWLRIDEHGHAEAGIQLLARRALPAGVLALDEGDARVPVRGLLLAPLAADTGVDYPALLVSTEIERGVHEVELSVPADLEGARLPARTLRASGLRLHESTGIYQHFALAPPTDANAVAGSTAAIAGA